MRIADTARLTLREVLPADEGALAAVFADPRVMYFGPGVRDRHETSRWIAGMQETYRRYGYGLWAVEPREGGDRLIGLCGLIPQVVEGADRIEVGYRLARRHWGRGFATEAARAVRDLAFERFGFDRVISLVEPANAGSIRVAEKNGMTFERLVEMWNRLIRVYAVEHRG